MDRGEMCRVSSFSSFPAEANVSPLILARCGLYYDGTKGTIRCAACDVEFHPREHSSSSVLERHRQQSSVCPFAFAASAPNTPPNLPGMALPVVGHTATDDGSEIGPDDRMNSNLWHIFNSASARATKRGVFQANSGSNTEPSGSDSPPREEHADPQRSTQSHVLYRREPSGSHSLPGSHAYPQESTQGHALCRREQLDHEQLQSEESRLRTFSNWPVDACVDRQALAREGFFYTGQGDRVQCAFCHGRLKNWKATDVIKAKHQKYSPNCPFIQGFVVSGRPSNVQTSYPSSTDSPESSRNQRVTVDDPVSAVMDRDEVSVLIPIIGNLGFNENDLRTLVTERLSQGDVCLSPPKLLTALLTYQRM